MVKAATLAGYSGTGDQLRSAGSRAEGTTAVDGLLTLAAAAESGAPSELATDAEIERKLTKLIRNPDGAISLKAIEAFDRRNAAKAKREEEARSADGFIDIREELRLISQISPELAEAYAKAKGFSLPDDIKSDKHLNGGASDVG